MMVLKNKWLIVIVLALLGMACDLEDGNQGGGNQAPTYTLTFVTGEGATGSVPAMKAKAGDTVIIPNADRLSHATAQFGGWHTERDYRGGQLYAAGSDFTMPNRDTTLYAFWNSSTTNYTVTFNANDGSGTAPAAQTVQSGSSITLPGGNGLSMSGCTFGGWNTNAAGTGTNYSAGASFTVTGNVTLYAKWDTGGGGDGTVQGNTLAEKLSLLKSNAVSGGNYTLEVNANESIAPQDLSYSGKSNITITLRGTGSNRTISLSSNGSMFTVGSGVTLVLDNNITLQGRSSNTAPLVYVSGNLTMNTGATITGNTSPPEHGGGVEVTGSFTMNGGTITGNGLTAPNAVGAGGVEVYGGSFTMKGGNISNNIGRGVHAAFHATFTMSGGTISGNSASSGGGVFIHDWAYPSTSFTMTGGTISGNTAKDYGIGVNGGGVYVGHYGCFTKTGGTITGYDSDTANGNVVMNASGVVQNYCGHAVYAHDYKSDSSAVVKRKDTTAGPSVNLSFTGGPSSTASGAWDN